MNDKFFGKSYQFFEGLSYFQKVIHVKIVILFSDSDHIELQLQCRNNLYDINGRDLWLPTDECTSFANRSAYQSSGSYPVQS